MSWKIHTILQSQFSGRRSRYFVQAKLIQKAKNRPTLVSFVSQTRVDGAQVTKHESYLYATCQNVMTIPRILAGVISPI